MKIRQRVARRKWSQRFYTVQTFASITQVTRTAMVSAPYGLIERMIGDDLASALKARGGDEIGPRKFERAPADHVHDTVMIRASTKARRWHHIWNKQRMK